MSYRSENKRPSVGLERTRDANCDITESADDLAAKVQDHRRAHYWLSEFLPTYLLFMIYGNLWWFDDVIQNGHRNFTESHSCSNVKISWWPHQMETFSALLAICAGNSPVPGEFPTQRLVTRSFDVFFDLRLNKRFSKQSCGGWFETLSCPLWRHRNDLKVFHHHRLSFQFSGFLNSDNPRPLWFGHQLL